MPQIQMVDFGPDPVAEALKKGASGFGQVMNKNLDQQRENDAVRRLTEKYKPDMSQVEFLRETLGHGGDLPVEKRAAIFDALTKAQSADTALKDKEKAEKAQKAQALALAKQEGIPEDIAKDLTPAQILQYVKDTKNRPNFKGIRDFISDPNLANLSDIQKLQLGIDKYGLTPQEASKVITIDQTQRQEGQNAQIALKDSNTRWKDYVDKINHDAELSRLRMHSYDEARELFKTNKTGPKNFRNFIANTETFKGTMLGNLIEHPENQALRALEYASIIGTKQDFGVRLSDADLRTVQNKIISADKTPVANEMIMNFSEIKDKMAIEKERLSQEIRREYKGYAPSDFDILLSDKLKQSPLVKEFEKAALEIMSLNDKGQVSGIWMIDPDTGDRELINKDAVKDAESLGFKRL